MAAAVSLLSTSAFALRRLSSPANASRSAQFKRFDRVRRFTPAAMSTSSGPKEAPANNPGLHAEIDPATKGYFMQQTMFRVKDPKVSLDFYSRVMGMSLLKRLDFPEMKFSLYFLGYENVASAPADPVKRTEWTFGQKATLELTQYVLSCYFLILSTLCNNIIYFLSIAQMPTDSNSLQYCSNWGTENDPEFKGYHNGNSDPRGFGHIGVTVDDVYKACERFEHLGVEFVKKPDDGKMKGIAFIKDPDGYWIEIFDLNRIGEVTATAS
ncbi:hypothetical protein ABZP36_029719 [Zizania latifolia]